MGSVEGTCRAGWRGRLGAAVVAVVPVVAVVGAAPPTEVGAAASGQAGGRGAVDLLGVESEALDINDRGVVVGYYVPGDDGVRHGFRRSARGRVIDLGPGRAQAVNDAGVVVGERTGPDGMGHATRWTTAGSARDLGLPGSSSAFDINDHGTIVGDAGGRAFVIERGATPELLAHPGDTPGSDTAVAINERGDIVGTLIASDGTLRPLLWDGPDHLPTLLPARRDLYDVRGINERGTIAGTTADELGRYQAVMWTGHDHREIDVGEQGVYSLARAINDKGQIVGVRYLTGEAFMWDPRTNRSTILTGLTTVRNEAFGINDKGAIVGYSTTPEGKQLATLFARR